MRYLALVALLAFLAVPFLAGCSEKPATPAKPAAGKPEAGKTEAGKPETPPAMPSTTPETK
jgi:hypothetical protein